MVGFIAGQTALRAHGPRRRDHFGREGHGLREDQGDGSKGNQGCEIAGCLGETLVSPCRDGGESINIPSFEYQ